MTRLRWVVLGMAVTSSMATSQVDVDPYEGYVEGPALLWSATDLEVEVTYATQPDCEAIQATPWLAGAASFDGTPVMVTVRAKVPAALPMLNDQGMVDTGYPTPREGCTVARLSTAEGDSVVFLPVGSWTGASGIEVETDDLYEGLLAFVPEGGTWNDGGLDVVQPLLDDCETVAGPRWTPAPFVGDVEIDDVREDQGCTRLMHDQGELEVCGVDVPVADGDLVRLDVDADHLDIDVFAGGRLYVGSDVEGLDIEVDGIAPDHNRRCAQADACGAVGGVLHVGGTALRAGERVDLDGAVLTVVSARVGVDIDCGEGAVVSYVQR